MFSIIVFEFINFTFIILPLIITNKDINTFKKYFLELFAILNILTNYEIHKRLYDK